jgi:hypothetical protein
MNSTNAKKANNMLTVSEVYTFEFLESFCGAAKVKLQKNGPDGRRKQWKWKIDE